MYVKIIMPPKQTKAEQAFRTQRAILDRARHLFSTKGYAATGTEEIIGELAVTRGALYHHFKDKSGLFAAVVAEAYRDVSDYINAQVQTIDDPWEQLVFGCQSFLEVVQQDDLRRLLLIEAPAVLSAEALMEFDQYGFGLLQASIQDLVQAGQLQTIDSEGFSHLVNGALNELATWIAQADHCDRLETAKKLIEVLLTHHRKA